MSDCFSGGTEGLSTKIVATFKGVLGDSNFSDFEADGSGIRAFTSATNATFFCAFSDRDSFAPLALLANFSGIIHNLTFA